MSRPRSRLTRNERPSSACDAVAPSVTRTRGFTTASSALSHGLHASISRAFGGWWITTRTVNDLRWAAEGRQPTRADQRNVFFTPWRVAVAQLTLWAVGTVVFTILYGLYDTDFVPRFALVLGFAGLLVSTSAYLTTEFALRPVAALALAAGPPPHRLAPGIMGRTMTVWMLGSGVPVIGIGLSALSACSRVKALRTGMSEVPSSLASLREVSLWPGCNWPDIRARTSSR